VRRQDAYAALLRPLRATEIGTYNDALGVGEHVGVLPAARDVQCPTDVAACRTRQDERLLCELHMRDDGHVLIFLKLPAKYPGEQDVQTVAEPWVFRSIYQ
jgi:hypothetical protein